MSQPFGPHIHQVIARGREYFYFQLRRNTPSAGPRIRISDPHSVEEAMRAYELSCTAYPLRDPRREIRRAYTATKARCRAGSIPFYLTISIVEKMLIDQNFRCAVSGLPFEQGGYEGCHTKPFGISIDRIKPGGPYSVENVRLVCQIANCAMGEWGEGALEKLAEAVSSRARMRTAGEPLFAKPAKFLQNKRRKAQ